MRAIRQWALWILCLHVATGGVCRAQGAQRADASAKGGNSVKETRAQSGGGSSKENVQGGGGSSKENSQGGGGMALQKQETGGIEQGNLDVVMELIGGSQKPSPPPPSSGGGGALKAASELGGGQSSPEVKKVPSDERGPFRPDPAQLRKMGS